MCHKPLTTNQIAWGVQYLLEKGYTVKKISEYLGWSESWVRRLGKKKVVLSREEKEEVRRSSISKGERRR